jgi:DNA-binding MarR family transcriptional regulator
VTSTTCRLVGQLVLGGWAERVPAPDDGRGVLVRVTAQGKTAADQLAAARSTRFEAVLERVPAEQRETVLRALAMLTEAVDER